MTITACSAARPNVQNEPSRPAVPLEGRVVFDARSVTPRGYSRLVQTRPARFVRVQLFDGENRVLAETRTDNDGGFSFPPNARAHQVHAFSSVKTEGPCDDPDEARCIAPSTLDVTSDAPGEHPYDVSARIPSDGSRIEVHAKLDGTEQAGGAFHILDTILSGLQSVHRWTGKTLPPLFIVWQHEGPLTWSYYRGERPQRSGRYVLELMGGERGKANTSDSDEHDEVVILHEFGHFVFDVYSTNSSVGGMHPRQALVHPGLAWEEGRASWFAACVLKDSMYRDAIGVEPRGSLRVEENLERLNDDAPRGIGSEGTVMEILWDLADGALSDGTTALEDRDADGVALGPKAMLAAMFTLKEQTGTYPSIVTFLRHLANKGVLSDDQARKIVTYPSQQRIEFPPQGQDESWPRELKPGRTRARIDGLTDPAPSGGRAHPENGFDAIHSYRFELRSRARVSLEMTIRGSGRGNDHTDVDLMLRDTRANVLESSLSETASEHIEKVLDAGVYIVDVKDGGNGNRADYELNFGVQPP